MRRTGHMITLPYASSGFPSLDPIRGKVIPALNLIKRYVMNTCRRVEVRLHHYRRH
jgi:hypothetical protein